MRLTYSRISQVGVQTNENLLVPLASLFCTTISLLFLTIAPKILAASSRGSLATCLTVPGLECPVSVEKVTIFSLQNNLCKILIISFFSKIKFMKIMKRHALYV